MPRPPTFDAHDVAAAGLAVVREGSWAAVSVRSVAAALGVTPMALYRVVPDADALRRLVADGAAAAMQPEAAPGEDPGEVLARWARAAHADLARHPGLAAFVVGEWTELPRWLDVVEGLLGAAEAAGRRGRDAVAAANAVFSYVLARAQLRDGVTQHRDVRPVRDDRRRYPRLAANLRELTTARTDRHFEIGLDALLAGLGLLSSRP